MARLLDRYRTEIVGRLQNKLGRKNVQIGPETFHKGDRVTFMRNASTFGVSNGDSGTIVRIGKRRITRKLFHGKRFRSLWSMLKYAETVKRKSGIYVTVKLDNGQVVDIPLACIQDYSAQPVLTVARQPWSATEQEATPAPPLTAPATVRPDYVREILMTWEPMRPASGE